MARVLVTGGAGYVGSQLIPKLLDKDYEVVCYDLMIYGEDVLPKSPKLRVVKADLRETEHFSDAVACCDSVIHLACISNDPSFELNPNLGKSINFDCFEPMVKACVRAGVKRFINASSSSVYGVSEADRVTEEHPLNPLTDYSKFKMMTEQVLSRYQSKDFTTVTIRPATVCGYSPRTRLDLSVNILTNLAVNKGVITVFGGSQKRPNIHVDDISDLYVQLLETPADLIAGQAFNAGYQNYSIAELAQMVKKVVEQEFPEKGEIKITTSPTNDLRSYHVTSEKITNRLGFSPQHTVEDAIRDLCKAFKQSKLPDSLEASKYFNIKRMKELELN